MPCNTVLTSDGKAAPDDKTAANALGEFYKGVGNLEFNQNDVILRNMSKRIILNCRTSSSGNHIFINKFTLRELNFALRAMDHRKSPGPDGIHGFMIGHLGPHGMQKRLDIFNFSWKIGRLPRDWKRAIIIPILKPGKDTSTSASYRHIALTSFVCKLMKRRVLARLNVHLNNNGLLPSEQQGVPQGSVLSPILFSLYITGIEKLLAKHCEVGIFADDIIVWSSGFDVGENELKLNRAMGEAHSFAEMHKLIFNASKSLTTFFSTNRHLFNYQPKISMNGIQLCYVKNAKYLGYTLDQEITINKHIEGQVIKVRKILNVLKFISGRDWGAEASTLHTTFISLIRPVLEFAIPIYSCASDTNLNKLERVQLCAARIITGLRYSC
ncbi:putative RNA-directed DNA polymerase from transposon BS [Trichonephila clavipes]|nr:putative RNA-directed DNA polymerase from transposon BS [Trichonephila clavipes]